VGRIMVIYHSQQSGNTKKMAELVAEGAKSAGAQVELVNVNEKRADMADVEKADGLALGTPDYFTYMAGGLKQFFDDALIAEWGGGKIKGKPCVVFVTHGGGGGAVASVEKLVKALEFRQIGKSLSSKGAPSGNLVDESKALGKALAEAL
jgi:NAD(P)H dehydrogenase (quinone)